MKRGSGIILVMISLGGAACSAQPAHHANPEGGTSTHGFPTNRPRPDIVFILTDDLSWNLVDFMPAVQQLAREGLTFTKYFVTDSLCCPSRASIFTGEYPHDTHVRGNTPPAGGYAVFESEGNQNHTFATALSAADYATGMMGKYLNGYEPDAGPPDPGWHTWNVAGDAYPEYDYQMNQDGRLVSYGSSPKEYMTDVLSRLADRYVQDVGSTPFFLEVATFSPHQPYVPAPRYVGKFHAKVPRTPSFAKANKNPPRWLAKWPVLTPADIAKLDADFNLRVESVQAVDDLITSLRAKLKASGRDKNTYFIFSSDNGYHMGEHMLHEGKKTAFEVDVRVPLIVVGPGVPAGAVDDHIVLNIDLCPTFIELAGAEVPASSEGHTLLPLLRGEKVGAWRSVGLLEHSGRSPPPPGDPDNEEAAGPEPTTYEALRWASSVFVHYKDGENEYYDLSSDPWEQTNTAGTLSAAQVDAYLATIHGIKTCHSADACWAAER